MFDHKHYVPILTGKLGEYLSLSVLTPDVKLAMTPLIEVPPIAWDYEGDTPSKTIDQQLSRTADNLYNNWGTDQRFFIDLFTVANEDPMADGRHPLAFVFDEARSRGLLAVPVTGIKRDADYQSAVQQAVGIDDRGICIRLVASDISIRQWPDDLTEFVASISLGQDDIDLILDLGPMMPGQQTTYGFVAQAFLSRLPNPAAWRSLTLAGSAFPEDASGFSQNAVGATPRTEWEVWTALSQDRGNLSRLPTFGDYAIDHPEYRDMDFRVIKRTAQLRYTAESEWLIVRGAVVQSGAASQYPSLALALSRLPQYSGPGFSWGDRYIQDCANGVARAGNATKWRQVGTNHHLTFVVRQIANYPGL